MIAKYDSQIDESLARGGSFDISGVTKVDDKQFWGFVASEGAKIAEIKGVALKTVLTDLTSVRTAEVDISGILVTSLLMGLSSGILYRADGYIITSITLADVTSLLHCYKLNQDPIVA